MNTRQDFDDATAFELLLLQTILEAGESSSQDTLDLTCPSGKITIHICSEVAMSDNDVNALKVKLLPLAFGAGWKIVDLLIEYEIAQAGLNPTCSRIPIKQKKNYSLNRTIQGTGIRCEQQTWNCLLDLYAHTAEHRHCLVHRTAQVDWATGALNGIDENTKQALVTLTREEQLAFANSAVLAAKGFLNGGIRKRCEAFLKFYLNQLANHSRAGIISGASAPRTVAVKIPLERDEQGWFVDLEVQLKKLSRQQLTDYYDILIANPAKPSLKMQADSESMPHQKTYIDLNSPPGWLRIG
jgi:hypothetical protein